MKYGFIKVAAAVPAVRVADVEYNVQEIEKLIAMADGDGVELICFPELSLTGYTCQDLFKEKLLLEKSEVGLLRLLDFTRQLDIVCVVGLPVQAGGLLLNCAAVIQGGALLGVVPKTYLPNYNEFYEKRWFASSQDLNDTDIYLAGTPVALSAEPKLFQMGDVKFGVEICEDVWAPIPPSNNLTMAGADIIVNLSASDELIGKHNYLRSLVAQQSARTMVNCWSRAIVSRSSHSYRQPRLMWSACVPIAILILRSSMPSVVPMLSSSLLRHQSANRLN